MSDASDAQTGLLLSGGLDSGILLGHLLASGRRVRPIHVACQLAWEREERAAVRRLLRALACPTLENLVTLEMPLRDLYGNHWSIIGHGTPDADSPDEAVYLPGRNALLAIKPMLWCRRNGIDELALAVLEGNPFSDATTAFFDRFESAMHHAVGGQVSIVRPFAHLAKREVMELGRAMPLGLTFSCIAPVDGRHCGQCNKCAERNNAFRSAGIDDPTEYCHTPVDVM